MKETYAKHTLVSYHVNQIHNIPYTNDTYKRLFPHIHASFKSHHYLGGP